MAESEDLKASIAFLRTEFNEGLAKFLDVSARLEEALKNDGDFDALKTTVASAAVEIRAIAEGMNSGFGTEFSPSQQ